MNKNEQTKVLTAGAIWALAIILLGMSFFGNSQGIKDPKYNVDPALEPYLKSFVTLANLKGIDLSYIYTQDITIKFSSYDVKTNVATAYGRNKDEIIIIVKKDRFYNRTEEGRKYVMFHEFGHDILNFAHLEHPERGMMEPTAYTGFFKNYDRFSQETQQKYLYKSLGKMFDRFIAKTTGANLKIRPWETTKRGMDFKGISIKLKFN